MASSVCEGLLVLEVGSGSVAGSFAGMLLADAGARVVKIEAPAGDRLRQDAPSGFLVWNRGKESVVADLGTEQGRSTARGLVAAADVVISGFGLGVAEGFGLGYDDVQGLNPAAVYCRITGFGSSGPYASLPAYEGVVAAKAGVYNAGAWGYRPGPIFFSVPVGSVGTGHQAFSGILTALMARIRTGRGQLVEANLWSGFSPLDYFGTVSVQLAMRAAAAAGTSGSGAGNPLAGVAASRFSFLIPTQDGRWVAFTQMMARQAKALARAVGIEHTFDDPRFARQPFFDTPEDAQEWEDLVWLAMHEQPYAYWEERFLADPDIAFELCRTSVEGLDHPQIRHNGEVIEVDDATLGRVRMVGPVAQLRDTPMVIDKVAPALGAHAPLPTGPRPALTPAGGDPHPLRGVTIVELGYFYAMPYGITMAAALGARVIKIEGETGDPMRISFGAPEAGAARTMEGKESFSVDLQSEPGRQAVRDLVAKADVFVNGFRPGVAERMGLGYDDLKAVNDRLVYLHASGYGASGAYAHRPIYAQVAQAVAGSINRYAGTWLDPDLTMSLGPFEAQAVIMPRVRGLVDGDSNAAIAVLSSLMLGIYHQQTTGRGQFLSTTMIGGNSLTYADGFVDYENMPPLATQDEENHGLSATYRLYKAADGWVFLAVPKDSEWERLVVAADVAELRDDRFTSAVSRAANDGALIAQLEAMFATRSAAAWEELLVPVGVACVKVADGAHSLTTCTDPALREMGLVVEVEHPAFGKILRQGLPVRLSESLGRTEPGCLCGQHTKALLQEIGYSDDRIAELLAARAVFALS